MEEVLQGIRVLDFSSYKAGPTCGQILADMGAEVIRVEKPGGEEDGRLGPFTPDGKSLYLMFTSRNKKAVTLNIWEPKGREIMAGLVKQCDVVIENFGPEVNKKAGLDYESLKEHKPDIIVVAVSAYGQYGPYASRRGFDAIAQAMSGLMWVTGFPQGLPVRLGVSFVDTVAGFYAALGTMYALYHRRDTGEGQKVDISLLDTAVSLIESTIAEYEVGTGVRPQVGNAHTFVAPYDAYRARDGYFYIGVVGSSAWKRFLKLMGREQLANEPGLQTDYERAKPENRQYFFDWVNQWAADKSVAEVVNLFNGAGVPCGPVNTIPQVAIDPHIQAREMLVRTEHPGVGKVPLIGIPIKLSKTPGRIKSIAPGVGEHNETVYGSLLGYTQKELNRLKEEGII